MTPPIDKNLQQAKNAANVAQKKADAARQQLFETGKNFAQGMNCSIFGNTQNNEICNHPSGTKENPEIGDLLNSLRDVGSTQLDLLIANGKLNEAETKSFIAKNQKYIEAYKEYLQAKEEFDSSQNELNEAKKNENYISRNNSLCKSINSNDMTPTQKDKCNNEFSDENVSNATDLADMQETASSFINKPALEQAEQKLKKLEKKMKPEDIEKAQKIANEQFQEAKPAKPQSISSGRKIQMESDRDSFHTLQKDPSEVSNDVKTHLAALSGNNKVDYGQISQGKESADCAIYAVINTLLKDADFHDKVENMVESNVDGSYTVHLPDKTVTIGSKSNGNEYSLEAMEQYYKNTGSNGDSEFKALAYVVRQELEKSGNVGTGNEKGLISPTHVVKLLTGKNTTSKIVSANELSINLFDSNKLVAFHNNKNKNTNNATPFRSEEIKLAESPQDTFWRNSNLYARNISIGTNHSYEIISVNHKKGIIVLKESGYASKKENTKEVEISIQTLQKKLQEENINVEFVSIK